jgi:hypothetical protein
MEVWFDKLEAIQAQVANRVCKEEQQDSSKIATR